MATIGAAMPSLADHLAQTREKQAAFARRAGLSRAQLSRVLSGKRPPTVDVVDKVEAATNGVVTANDLFAAYRAARAALQAGTGAGEAMPIMEGG
ncbi:helix-turn-helix transcriptional regulator [Vineibacter terrae]|uniref:Helix-turn-helix transcriptional regulator n=1 Tax=Vineibacter terrae TaxID=2586908 RepID=A0A5C8PFU7_9HYPH|nr:helix-turn-helix transcriptional regulator [Vineibacter terrae]TXL72535.1 helix-turn-helix transcriptional regulator [Vineibacter terrae]